MPRENFRENYAPGEAYLVRGGLLNAMARVANAQAAGVAINSGTHSTRGTVDATAPPPYSVMGIAVITDASNTCEIDLDSGQADAPCARLNKYLARFRWFDHSNGIWQQYDEDLRLDAGAYWEGVLADEATVDLPVVAGVSKYPTDASKDPASGPGFGQIPQFQRGDIVPAFWDAQRGWMVPIVSPYDHAPVAEFVSESDEAIPVTGDEVGTAVQCYLEVQQPGGLWETLDRVSWRVPPENEGDWYDSRAGNITFDAPRTLNKVTYVRFRFVTTLDEYDLFVTRSVAHFWGASRRGKTTVQAGRQTGSWTGGKARTNWELNASLPGRFADSPVVQYIGNGTFRVNYADLQDGWVLGCDWQFEIGNSPDSSSSSSSSSSSPASSSSSSSSSPSSRTAPQEYCQCTLVSDVICDGQGHVVEVCYTTILFPKVPGIDCASHCGTEICVPCDEGTSSPSSASSSSSSSTTQSPSSQSLSSQSSQSSSSTSTLSSASSDLSSSSQSELSSSSSASSSSLSSTLSDVSNESSSCSTNDSSSSSQSGVAGATAWTAPGTTGTTAPPGGTVAWTSHANVKTDDSNAATATLTGSFDRTSESLAAYNFGFAIPGGATVDKVELRMRRYYQTGNGGDCSENVIDTRSPAIADKSTGAGWAISQASAETVTFEWTSADGTMPTAAQVNASTFGVNVSATKSAGSTTSIASIEYIEMRIHYS